MDVQHNEWPIVLKGTNNNSDGLLWYNNDVRILNSLPHFFRALYLEGLFSHRFDWVMRMGLFSNLSGSAAASFSASSADLLIRARYGNSTLSPRTLFVVDGVVTSSATIKARALLPHAESFQDLNLPSYPQGTVFKNLNPDRDCPITGTLVRLISLTYDPAY